MQQSMQRSIFHNRDQTISKLLEHCHTRNYNAKSVIIKEGDPSAHLYYILSGSVTVLIEDHKGREIVLSYLNPGDFFGEIGLFDEEHKRSAFVRAKSKCEIAQISYERLKSLNTLFPDLLFAIATQMALRLRKTSRKVSDLAFTDVKGRVARTLLEDGMQIKITRQELGRIVGCSREMVGRVLKSLEEDHLISVSGKTIVVFGTR